MEMELGQERYDVYCLKKLRTNDWKKTESLKKILSRWLNLSWQENQSINQRAPKPLKSKISKPAMSNTPMKQILKWKVEIIWDTVIDFSETVA